MIGKRGDFRVRVERHEIAAELVAVADLDEVGVVFGLRDTEFQQLFEHDGYLDPVGRCQGIQLQGVFAHGQRLVVCRSGDGAVDAGESAAAFHVPLPERRGRIGGCFRHVFLVSVLKFVQGKSGEQVDGLAPGLTIAAGRYSSSSAKNRSVSKSAVPTLSWVTGLSFQPCRRSRILASGPHRAISSTNWSGTAA